MSTNTIVQTEQIWKRFGAHLHNFIRQRISDEQAAEDVLQETFMRVHKQLHTLQDRQRIAAWIFRIARNTIIDHYRAQARIATAKADDLELHDADSENLNEHVMAWFPGMIEQLPERYREAVYLYEIEGIPQKDIAAQLGLSLSGAKSRIQRGRSQLKTVLHDCCTFTRDRRGNIIDYEPKIPKTCAPSCTEEDSEQS